MLIAKLYSNVSYVYNPHIWNTHCFRVSHEMQSKGKNIKKFGMSKCHYLNKTTLDANCVFTRVFSFFAKNLTSTQVLCQSIMPLPNFLVHVIIICKVACAFFKLTHVIRVQSTMSFMPYCQALDITCLKQLPCGLSSSNGLHFTTSFRVVVNVFKLVRSSLT